MDIAIELQKFGGDWLNDDNTRLYLGIDHVGEYVIPARAKTLECWRLIPNTKRVHGPAFKENPGVLALALLCKDGKYYSFYISAQGVRNGELVGWLNTLHRFPEGDINELIAGGLYTRPNCAN